ncbi:MAG TPA: alanine--tRNA ligase, partial [Actinobacteria bacterium]|nr:alanine--tRNA ligase [Actinomycetota bacterium]
IDYARDMGAMALFDEKYGEFVRVIEVGDFSRELCGGTHVMQTAEIGAFKILSESSVGANIRRIEAITSREAIDYLRGRDAAIEALSRRLKTEPERLEAVIGEMEEELAGLRAMARDASRQRVAGESRQLAEQADDLDGIKVLAAQVETGSPEELMELSDHLKEQLGPSAIMLAADQEGKVVMVANFADQAVDRGARAGDLIKEIAPVVGGKGGGKATMARGGGGDVASLDQALDTAREWFKRKLA